jgi:tRNA dimethylallyltransferase
VATIEVICGPTASGKSALALERAKADPSIEIVNADASAIYIGFDIGTAKPTREEQAVAPHHLIDIVEPHIRFSAFEYSQLARTTIKDILDRGKKPLVVGGTGFYIDALFFGVVAGNASEEVIATARDRAAKEIEENGFDEMHLRLKAIDPDLWSQINRERNPMRLQRAWEYYYANGEPLGEARKKQPEVFEHAPIFTVLEPDREELWRRIEDRTDRLLNDGWIEEVRGLLAKGVTVDMPAMRAIGYQEIAQFLEGELSKSELREKIVIATRQYAKRQSTWFKRYLRSAN